MTELASVATQLTSAEGVWTSEVAWLEPAAGNPNVEDLLEAGDDLINTVNVGSDVPELYRRFAETTVLVARAYEQKRADFLTEAARLIDKANLWVGEAQNRIQNAGQYLQLAERFKAEAVERRNEAWAIWNAPNQLQTQHAASLALQPANY